MEKEKDKKRTIIIIAILILLLLLLRGCPTEPEPTGEEAGFSVSFYDREGNLLRTVGTPVPGSKLASVEEDDITTYNVAYMSFEASVLPSFSRIVLNNFEVREMSGNIVWEPVYYPFQHMFAPPTPLLTGMIFHLENSLDLYEMWKTGADCIGMMGVCDICTYRGNEIPLTATGTWYGGDWQSTCVELAGGVFDIVLEVESFAGPDPDFPNRLDFCVRVGGDISIDNGVTWHIASEKIKCIRLDIRPDPTMGDYILIFERI